MPYARIESSRKHLPGSGKLRVAHKPATPQFALHSPKDVDLNSQQNESHENGGKRALRPGEKLGMKNPEEDSAHGPRRHSGNRERGLGSTPPERMEWMKNQPVDRDGKLKKQEKT